MSLAVLADHMASKGRGPDSMLIHMSPREVQGLQALAENHGGSLTINPETGLPEAGFLDKLLPTIIGFALNTFAPGVGTAIGGALGTSAAVGTGIAVGGAQALRTGDIGKGISAGLGAYGGASLGANLAAAGTGAISSEVGGEALKAAGLTGEAALTAEADQIAQRAIEEKLAASTPLERLSAGADVVKDSPMKYLKANAKPLMYALGPAILAGESAQENMPKTTTGMIRPYSFDPYSGTYTTANPYQATPTRAAGGGLMDMDNGGYNPGQLDFTQRSEPVVRMAEGGGVVALAGGGDYRSLTKDSSAADIASAYKQFTTASGGDTAANQKAAVDYLTNLGIGQDKIGQAYGTYQASPTYTAYTPEQMGSFLSNPVNKDINLDKAIIDANANPADVNRYIASLSSPFVGSTWDKGGSGTLGIYNDLVAKSIDPNEYYAAAIANDPKYAGWTKDMINRGYSLTGGALDLSKQIEKDKIAADPVFGYDKQWVKFMDDNKYDANDMAQALGLSIKDVTNRYNAVKAAEKIITKTGGTGTNTGVTTTTPITYNTAGTNAPGGLESVLGLPPGVSGAGITTVNPNGTITTRPDLTLPMSTVRDDYVRGGGNLGYTSPTFASLKAVEDKYPLRGGSKQSYDFLTGKTDYDPVPYTKTGELMKPYSSSVLGIPMASSKQMYLFDPATKTYKINPDYAIPTYDKEGKKSLALTNQDVINYVKSPEYSNDDAFVSWMTANNLTPEQIAAATGISIADVYKKIKKAKPVEAVAAAPVTGQNDGGGGGGGEANGGLMSMARGGMAQQFNLGDYSDGGRLLRGPGDGVSDSIPASIGGKRPARLADGEFVVPARIVSELGNGSTEAGARKLYAMMDRVQSARRGTVGRGRVAKNSRADKHLPV